MDREQTHETINRLVEAEFDRRDRMERLDRFRQTQNPPLKPDQFENLTAFLNFHEAKRRYETEHQSLKSQHEEATNSYNQAKRTLRDILPENTPLHYDYEGNRREFAGVHFIIVNQAGTITIS